MLCRLFYDSLPHKLWHLVFTLTFFIVVIFYCYVFMLITNKWNKLQKPDPRYAAVHPRRAFTESIRNKQHPRQERRREASGKTELIVRLATQVALVTCSCHPSPSIRAETAAASIICTTVHPTTIISYSPTPSTRANNVPDNMSHAAPECKVTQRPRNKPFVGIVVERVV